MNFDKKTSVFQDFTIEWARIPWDSQIMGLDVGQIYQLHLHNNGSCSEIAVSLKNFLLTEGFSLVSARFPVKALNKTMILEMAGFRFVEMTYQPCVDLQDWKPGTSHHKVEINQVSKDDLPDIKEIANCAFVNERFYVDPRLERSISGKRYSYWVDSAFSHPAQTLVSFSIEEEILGFFVIEAISQDKIYWHLTAISPQYQGKGYGYAVWLEMILLHKKSGYRYISTTISSQNLAVLNLYSKLNFCFGKPEIGFHFWAEEICR